MSGRSRRRATDPERALRRQGYRLIRTSLRPLRGWLVIAVGSALTWTAAKLAVPLLAAAAIDQGIIPGDTGAIILYASIIAAVGVVQGAGMGVRRYGAWKVAFRVETDLRERLFAHFQRLHFAFHDEAQTGQLMSTANTDILQVNQMLTYVPITISSIAVLVGVIIVMVAASPLLALMALGALPFLNFLATRFVARASPLGLEQQEKLGDVASVIEESVSGIRAVKGFGAEQLQTERLEREVEAVRGRALELARLRAGFLPVLDFVPALSLAVILWYGGHQVLDGSLEIGQIVAFNTYILMLILPLRMAGTLLALVVRASASAGRIYELLQTDADITSPVDGRALPDGGGDLRFEGVQFAYGDGPRVLDGIDLELRPGEAVAIVGPTASGKTTVARLIPRFYDVDAGRVTLDGVDVRELSLRDLRRAVGIVFEETFLFSDTVGANIAFAQPDATNEQIRRAAAQAGVSDFVESLPDGYDTVIGEHGYSLSGGQRQRIAIARAVLANPRVLILDDATSSVDPTKEHEIRDALNEVMLGRTTIVIAHRPATIALADRVVLISRGRIVADGTHASLLRSSPEYREVLAAAEAREHEAVTEVVGVD